jgi:hypothetical protein
MRVFLKNCLRIAGFSVLIGIVLCFVAFSIDNSVFDNWRNFNIPHGDNKLLSGFWSDWNIPANWDGTNGRDNQEEMHQDLLEHSDNEIEEDKDETIFADSGKSSDDIKSLSLDITYGTVTIQEGDSFDIEVNGMPEDAVKDTVENGVWNISDTLDKSEAENEISVFGFKISSSNSHPFKAADIKLTVPEDYVFENLDIILDAGTIKADNLSAQNADISVGAGSLKIDELTAGNKSSYSIDTGELIINDLYARDTNMNCGVGNLRASGVITGDNYVTCGIGNVDLDMDGDEEDYNYSIDCGIGTVIINSNTYSGVNSKTKKNNNAENSFTLDCGIGKISLNIQ